MAQFVPLKIHTDGDNWQAWASKHRHEGGGIPILYVVRPNGELVYAKSGSKAGDELPRFLSEHLATAGTIFSDGQLTLIKSAVEESSKSLAEGDLAAAVKRLEVLRKLGPLGKLGSYAAVSLEADALYLKLVEQGTAALKAAQEQLAGDEKFSGILGVVSANRIFGKLPELRKDLVSAQREITKNVALKEDLKQAEALDKALALLGQKNGSKLATPALEAVVTRFPGTPAAEHATAKLTELGAAVPAAQPAAMRMWSDDSGKFRIEAEFVSVADGKVQLKRKDGKVITIPLDRLSKADQEFIAQQ